MACIDIYSNLLLSTVSYTDFRNGETQIPRIFLEVVAKYYYYAANKLYFY